MGHPLQQAGAWLAAQAAAGTATAIRIAIPAAMAMRVFLVVISCSFRNGSGGLPGASKGDRGDRGAA